MKHVYVPLPWVNRITRKKKAAIEPILPLPNFSTWAEAHKWLVARRESQVHSAEEALRKANIQLKNARAMKEPK